MALSEPALHICIGDSAGGSLRQAGFGHQGSEVIAFPDDLSFGPIDPPDPAARIAWVKRELRPAHDRLVDAVEGFWTTVLSSPLRPIVWFSRRSASEHAGFLEYLWRAGDARCDVVDLTDFVPGRRPVVGVGELSADNIRANELVRRAAPLDPVRRAEYRAAWRQLRDESAPFRIVKDLQLMSAPITVYDELLLGCASANWQKTAMVVGKAMATNDGPVGDAILHGRIFRLVAAGRFEAQGDLELMRASEIRLPLSRGAGEGGAGEAGAG